MPRVFFAGVQGRIQGRAPGPQVFWSSPNFGRKSGDLRT